MERLAEFLRDWMREFVKNKNIMTRSVISIDEHETDLFVVHKDRRQHIIIAPFIDSFSDILRQLTSEADMHLSIVTFNSQRSFKAMLASWKDLAKHKNLSIYFANPFSLLDKKWIIYPYTHAKICDEESLELGLRSMFEMVDRITEQEAKAKI